METVLKGLLFALTFTYSGMAEHKITSHDAKGQLESYMASKEVTIEKKENVIIFETLGRDTFPIVGINTIYNNTCAEITYAQGQRLGKAIFCSDFIRFNLQKYGKKHTFVILINNNYYE